jgi:hypothetical protein
MTRRQFIAEIGNTWKGQQLRCLVPTPPYRHVIFHLAINCRTSDIRHAISRCYFNR